MKDIKISFMEVGDIEEAAKVLSIAMRDNPLHLEVYQDNDVCNGLEKMFVDLFTKKPGITFVAREDRKIVGVLRMNSCRGGRIVEEQKSHDENSLQYRKYVWFKEWAENDPDYQHWHLGPVGVLPSHRGEGIGRILMERFCVEVDACGSIAYLETDKDENVKFYEKSGFRLIGRSMIFNVESRYMERSVSE